MTAHSDTLQQTVEDLLHHEAALLDQNDLDAWLNLFARDCLYWIPLTPAQEEPTSGPSHVFDNRDTLQARILRLKDPANFPQQPPSRTSRLLGRIRIAADESRDTITANAPFHLIECLPHQDMGDGQRYFAGQLTYVLEQADGDMKIRSKRVDLINSEKGLHGVSIII